MSVISTVYDTVDTHLGTLFSGTHKKFYDPRELGVNDTYALGRGYGFYLGPGNNTNRNISCKLSVQRELVVSLSIINRGTAKDISIRQTAEKQLLEDHFTLIKSFEQDPTLEDLLAKLIYSGDNGIENVFTDRNNYLVIESSFDIEYFENL